MGENETTFSPEQKPELPQTLDIIRIDGRWAQIVEPGTFDYPCVVRFLDNKTGGHVDFNEYKLIQKHSKAVYFLLMDEPGKISEQEIKNIHWGADQDRSPVLQYNVRVFGEFERIA